METELWLGVFASLVPVGDPCVIGRCPRGSLTVDGQPDGHTRHGVHRVLHRAAVDVFVPHQHPRDGEQLLVGGQQEPALAGQRPSSFEPSVGRPGPVLVGAVEDHVLAELQHGRRLCVDVGAGDGFCGEPRADSASGGGGLGCVCVYGGGAYRPRST